MTTAQAGQQRAWLRCTAAWCSKHSTPLARAATATRGKRRREGGGGCWAQWSDHQHSARRMRSSASPFFLPLFPRRAHVCVLKLSPACLPLWVRLLCLGQQASWRPVCARARSEEKAGSTVVLLGFACWFCVREGPKARRFGRRGVPLLSVLPSPQAGPGHRTGARAVGTGSGPWGEGLGERDTTANGANAGVGTHMTQQGAADTHSLASDDRTQCDIPA
jgi:hypothetical protein